MQNSRTSKTFQPDRSNKYIAAVLCGHGIYQHNVFSDNIYIHLFIPINILAHPMPFNTDDNRNISISCNQGKIGSENKYNVKGRFNPGFPKHVYMSV